MVELKLDLDGEVVLIDKTVGLGLFQVVIVIGVSEEFVHLIEDFIHIWFIKARGQIIFGGSEGIYLLGFSALAITIGVAFSHDFCGEVPGIF